MRRVRPGAAASRGGTTSRAPGEERTLTSVAAGARYEGEEPKDLPRLWHVTLSVSGGEAPLKEVRRGLEQLAHDHPFLLTSRYANDHAEIRYWEEARDLHDADADLDMAIDILINSKAQRPSVCNAAETLLVHQDIAPEFLPRALDALAEAGVTVHADERVLAYAKDSEATVVEATPEDWDTEYLSYDIAAAVVDSLDKAVQHIRLWSSGHTEAIVTSSQQAARRFTQLVDSTTVAVNASTRFTDGSQFGFGAEIGISTQKLHARGPMGLPELTSTKYIVTGDGHIRR